MGPSGSKLEKEFEQSFGGCELSVCWEGRYWGKVSSGAGVLGWSLGTHKER